MNTNALYHQFVRTVAPNSSTILHASGDFLTCLEATGDFKLQFDSQPRTKFLKGLSYKSPTGVFGQVTIYNDTDGEVTITVGIGSGGISDNRFVAEGIIDTRSNAPSSFLTPSTKVLAAGVATEIFGVDDERSEVILRNMSTTETLWVTDGSEAAAGIPINGGEGFILETTDAVHVFNPNGIGVELAVAVTRNG